MSESSGKRKSKAEPYVFHTKETDKSIWARDRDERRQKLAAFMNDEYCFIYSKIIIAYWY